MKKLIINYLFTLTFQIMLMVTPIITLPYASRILGVGGIGEEAYVTSIVQLFLIFIVMSIPIYGSRQIAVTKDRADTSRVFWSIFLYQIVACLLIIIVFIIYTIIFSTHKSLFLINILTLLYSGLDISWLFIGKEKMRHTATRNISVKIIGIVSIFIFVNSSEDLWIYILINALTLFIGSVVLWTSFLKEVQFIRIGFKDVKKHLNPILILFIPQLMIQIYLVVNRVILGGASGEIEVGYYSQANKIIRIVLGVIGSLSTVMIPRLASEFSQGNNLLVRKYIDKSIQYILLITIPMTFGLIAITPTFVPWFFGEEFHEVSILLIVMSPVIVLVGLANVFGVQILVSTNQNSKYSIAISVGAFLSLITNLALVYFWGSLATTIALVVAEMAGAFISMYFAREYLSLKTFIRLLFKYSSLSLIIFIIIKLINRYFVLSPSITITLDIVLAIVIYVLGLLIIKDSILVWVFTNANNKIKKIKERRMYQ